VATHAWASSRLANDFVGYRGQDFTVRNSASENGLSLLTDRRLNEGITPNRMSIAASWMRAVCFAPSVTKKRSMSASVRPFPPAQIGLRQSRSLTTSSTTPIARSAGRPAWAPAAACSPVKVLDRAVVEALCLGHRRVSHLATERTHMHREALSEAWVLRQPVEALCEHATAPQAVDPKPLELDIDAEPADREVAYTAGACVVAPTASVSTLRADRCCFGAVTPGLWRSGPRRRRGAWRRR